MIDFKNKQSAALNDAIAAAGHTLYQLDNALVCSNETAVQAIIDAFVEPMPELDLQQLAYFLDTSSISDAATALFNATSPVDLVAKKKRALLKARYIQPRKCVAFEVFYNRVSQSAFKAELIAAYSAANPLLPPFAFNKASLQTLWLAAKTEDI